MCCVAAVCVWYSVRPQPGCPSNTELQIRSAPGSSPPLGERERDRRRVTEREIEGERERYRDEEEWAARVNRPTFTLF